VLIRMKLTVPLCRAQDARQLIEAGADEFYCGVMEPVWEVKGVSPNARRHPDANLNGFGELAEALQVTRRFNVPVFLCLNSSYGKAGGGLVKEYLRKAAGAGVSGFIIAEPALIPFVKGLGSRFKTILSTLAPACMPPYLEALAVKANVFTTKCARNSGKENRRREGEFPAGEFRQKPNTPLNIHCPGLFRNRAQVHKLCWFIYGRY